jgi:hypothetical protein
MHRHCVNRARDLDRHREEHFDAGTDVERRVGGKLEAARGDVGRLDHLLGQARRVEEFEPGLSCRTLGGNASRFLAWLPLWKLAKTSPTGRLSAMTLKTMNLGGEGEVGAIVFR